MHAKINNSLGSVLHYVCEQEVTQQFVWYFTSEKAYKRGSWVCIWGQSVKCFLLYTV